MTIATNDQTTAFVVAIPTPFAPSFASYPQLELTKAIAPPKQADLKRMMKELQDGTKGFYTVSGMHQVVKLSDGNIMYSKCKKIISNVVGFVDNCAYKAYRTAMNIKRKL